MSQLREMLMTGENLKIHVTNSNTGAEFYFGVSMARDNKNLGFVSYIDNTKGYVQNGYEESVQEEGRFNYMGLFKYDTKEFSLTAKSSYPEDDIKVVAFKYILDAILKNLRFPDEINVKPVKKIMTKKVVTNV